jgi:hypothetical protein
MGKFYQGLGEELSLYVRHMAWLNAVPDKATKSRREAMGTDPEMPPCDAQYLAAYLFEVGPSIAGAMGEGPLTHAELLAWQSNTGIELNAWESRMLKRLSSEYLNAAFSAKEPACLPPWTDAPDVATDEARVAADMKQSIRGLAAL